MPYVGYLFNPEATMEAIDEDGWLHSGDIGSQDEEGFVRITGRIKELIITAGGENIPPVVIEDQIKSSLPVISNAVVIGVSNAHMSLVFHFVHSDISACLRIKENT